MKSVFTAFLLFISPVVTAQNIAPLTVEKIMRDPKWIGTSPSNPYWSADGKTLFFFWNPDKAASDSVYYITLADRTPRKASPSLQQATPSFNSIVYNPLKTAYVYIKDGDVYYSDKEAKARRITQTAEAESSPQFMANGKWIVFSRQQNLFAWDISSGFTMQLTNFVRSAAPKEPTLNTQEAWLQRDALRMSEVLQERKERRDSTEAINKRTKPKELRSIYIEDKAIFNPVVSPDGRFMGYRLFKQAAGAKPTIVPAYVTESGFTTDISSRTNVGAAQGTNEFYIFDRERDTALLIKTDGIPGISDLPDYVRDYPVKDTSKRKPVNRVVSFRGPYWNDEGTKAVVDIRSADNKDRWLMLLDPTTGALKNIDRQRDEAWIAGPGIAAAPVWVDATTIVFQSEANGYSHVYKVDVASGIKTQLTNGAFEISNLQLSKDKKTLYFAANDLHPGDYQFYRMKVAGNGGVKEQLTSATGINRVSLSPDEKTMAVLYSYSNKPWELFLEEAKVGGKRQQITNMAQSDEFKSYAWRDPEIVTFTVADGATVYARLYKPASQQASKPAVIFVHGAGYLQNVHKGWSDYFHEYLFNNLLADNGYTVLDIDYRGSAGYGRAWRTGIYRYMGGKDLSDHVDGAKYLIEKQGVDPKRIGIYGGSYGGFITLMGLFTKPDVFASGAALRSVTDWAHYNHSYTSNILNEPFTDSLAYRRSSPIYYAEGLKGNLLMCHGMMDVNVHFQDIVRLTQRLIELKKENWELAVYPMEDHGFVEASSWTDEYKRVFALFERTLKK